MLHKKMPLFVFMVILSSQKAALDKSRAAKQKNKPLNIKFNLNDYLARSI